jgi:hypothetical protein
MHKLYLALALAGLLAGCQSSPPPPVSAQSGAPAAKSGDAVTQKLQELAGSGATDCGRIKFQPQGPQDATRNASSCAMQAAQQKHPFFVAYELPGLTVAIAGNSQGKLFSVTAEQAQGTSSGAAQLNSGPCPAELRLAESGRATCIPRGSMNLSGVPNPHGGMSMPPGQNPHGGMSMPPPGTPNPHGGGMPLPRTGKSKSGDTDSQPSSQDKQ